MTNSGRNSNEINVAREFITAMSRAASGVNIVATDGPHGRTGLTVSSMVSVSAEPPTLLVCVNRGSPAHDVIRDNGVFAISVLAEHQRRIADAFAGRGDDAYQYDPDVWETTSRGLPRVKSAAAFFECRLDECVRAGSHSIFIGRVLDAREGSDVPLLYGGRDYGRLARFGTKTVLEASGA